MFPLIRALKRATVLRMKFLCVAVQYNCILVKLSVSTGQLARFSERRGWGWKAQRCRAAVFPGRVFPRQFLLREVVRRAWREAVRKSVRKISRSPCRAEPGIIGPADTRNHPHKTITQFTLTLYLFCFSTVLPIPYVDVNHGERSANGSR